MADNIAPEFDPDQLNLIMAARGGAPLFGAGAAPTKPPAPPAKEAAPNPEEYEGKSDSELRKIAGGGAATEEDLSELSDDELKRRASGASNLSFDLGDITGQVKPGLKEAGAQLVGLPGNAVAGGLWGLEKAGIISPETKERWRANQGLPTSGELEQKWETPEELEGPKTLWGKMARTGISFLPMALATGLTGGAASEGFLAPMIQALARSGAAAGLSEGAGYGVERLGSPEIAPYARAAGAVAGFGFPKGVTLGSKAETAAREPYVKLLEAKPNIANPAAANPYLSGQGPYPVSVAERTGSRLAATLEQKPPVRNITDPILKAAEAKIPFPQPYGVSNKEGAITAALGSPAVAYMAHSLGLPAETGMLWGGLWGIPAARGAVGKMTGPLARSKAGQAWMAGWPGNPWVARGAMTSGPMSRGPAGLNYNPEEE